MFMFKRLKNNKGFTLIELMMVIAVIGILAAVLIPKIGGTKDVAKLAGMDSNTRVVESSIQGIIGRYQNKSASQLSTFGTAIQNTLSEVTSPFDASQVGAGTDSTSATAAFVSGKAVTISTVDNPAVPANNTSNKGLIMVTVDEAVSSSKYSISTVNITPYDNNGNAMPTITVSN